MIMKEIKLRVPSDVPSQKIKIMVAVQLFNDGDITLKQAADLTELSSWDFLHELGKHKISFTNIDIEDLRTELEESA